MLNSNKVEKLGRLKGASPFPASFSHPNAYLKSCIFYSYLILLCKKIKDGGHSTNIYYMAESPSAQDEANPAFWLATRTGKMVPSCPLSISFVGPQEKLSFWQYNKSFIDHASSFKMVDYRPRSFLRFYWPRLRLGLWKRKKKELGQYSAILNEDAWSITHTNKQLNLAHEKKDCLAG